MDLTSEQFVEVLIQGEWKGDEIFNLPIPNLMFTRDIGVVFGNSLLIANAYHPARKREQIIADFSNLNHSEIQNLANYNSLKEHLSNSFIENSVGTFSLPLGIATNFLINKEKTS